jgi:hypothetical protein
VSATYNKSFPLSNAKPEGDLNFPSVVPKEPNSKENESSAETVCDDATLPKNNKAAKNKQNNNFTLI